MPKNTPSIHAAWEAFAATLMPEPGSFENNQRRQDAHLAFWAGAATLFYALMLHGLDDGEEPTADDMARMDSIHHQVEDFAKGFDAEALKRMKAAVSAKPLNG
jgi:hypothetical protein